MESVSGPYAEYFRAAIDLARQAGVLVKDAFDKPKNMHIKSEDTDLVTETDKKCEEIIFAGLKKLFPDHLFVGEGSY
jgi:fructose-1,6-bisphosphatase/inositol monophosphatase family enzyme